MADNTLIVVDGQRRSTLEDWLREGNMSPTRMVETDDSVAAVFNGDRLDGMVAQLPPLLTDNLVAAVLVFGDEAAHGAVYQGERLAERGTASVAENEALVRRLGRFTSFSLPNDSW